MNWGLFTGVVLGVMIILNTVIVLAPVVPPITFAFFLLVGVIQITNSVNLYT